MKNLKNLTIKDGASLSAFLKLISEELTLEAVGEVSDERQVQDDMVDQLKDFQASEVSDSDEEEDVEEAEDDAEDAEDAEKKPKKDTTKLGSANPKPEKAKTPSGEDLAGVGLGDVIKNLNKILGTNLTQSTIKKGLMSLGLKNSLSNSNNLKVKVPSWRFDLKIEADLIEEIARLVGYNNIPQISLRRKIRTSEDTLYSSIRKTFQSMGYNEVITYSFIDQALAELVGEKKKQLIFVENPISQNMNVMRTSLLPGLLDTLSYNMNQGSEGLKIFEIGSVFNKRDSNKINEREVVGGLIVGIEGKDNWSGSNKQLDFFDLKGNLETVLPELSKFTFKREQVPFLHPGKTAALYKGQKKVGYLGTVNPKLLDKLDIKGEVNFFEFSLDEISGKKNIKFKKFSRFPLAQRDLSFVFDEVITSSSITDAILSKAGSNLKEINLFDIYTGKGISEGQKSLTYSLSWQAVNRTLTDDEVDKIIGRIVSFLSKKFNAKLRT